MLRLPTKSCLLEVVAANRRLQYPPVPQSRATFSGPSFGFPFRACHANRMLLGNGKIQQSVANTLSNGEVKTSILLQIRKGGLEFDKTPLLWRMNALYGCFSTNKSDLLTISYTFSSKGRKQPQVPGSRCQSMPFRLRSLPHELSNSSRLVCVEWKLDDISRTRPLQRRHTLSNQRTD